MANLNLKGSTFFETPCIVQVMTVKLFQVIVLKINALINMRLVIFFTIASSFGHSREEQCYKYKEI